MGLMRTILQRAQLLRIVAPLPAIKGFTADPEITASQGCIAAVSLVMIEPWQPLASLPAQFRAAPLQVPGAGRSTRDDLPSDTLPRVSTIILNENIQTAACLEVRIFRKSRRLYDCWPLTRTREDGWNHQNL